MAVLKDPRSELLAQGLSRGMTQAAAYAAAGYVGNASNAWRSAQRPAVQSRLAELMAWAAARSTAGVEEITARLLAVAARAEAGDTAPMLAIARAALMDVAKINRLAADKGEPAGAGAAASVVREIRRTIVDPAAPKPAVALARVASSITQKE